MTQSLLPVNGIKLFVDDTGETDLPVVLCLHSLFLDSRMFDGFVERAAGRYRVVRPEFRGQGRSDLGTDEQITMDQDADDMLAVIERLGLSDINVIAQSMGGDVGVRIVARRPELFRSLVMAGSSARSEPDGQREDFLEWIRKAGDQGFINDSLDETMAVMFGPTSHATTDPQRRATVELWRDRINATPRRLYPAMLGVILRENAVPLLPDIACPALIFSGTEDTARPPEWAKEVADGIPNSELITLGKVGHSPTLEVPDLVYPMILEFFDRHNS
jgi:pimeloyl-ACP methyl ester carboxylesterase